MRTETAIAWAGSQAELARRLEVTQSAVSQWAADGVIPRGRAFEIEVLSGGQVKVDLSVYHDKTAA